MAAYQSATVSYESASARSSYRQHQPATDILQSLPDTTAASTLQVDGSGTQIPTYVDPYLEHLYSVPPLPAEALRTRSRWFFPSVIRFHRAALVIQHAWKRHRVRQGHYGIAHGLYSAAGSYQLDYSSDAHYHDDYACSIFNTAAVVIQHRWHVYQRRRQRYIAKERKAVDMIKRAYQRFADRRIYQYFADLCARATAADPYMLLSKIDPGEAALMADRTMGLYVRFRLGYAGGRMNDAFPPTIYYKVYTRVNVSDINSYAPRTYTKVADGSSKTAGPVTYKRWTNNGWKPLTGDRLWLANDEITRQTAAQQVSYPHSKLVRQADRLKKIKQKKRAWMKQLYQQPAQAVASAGQHATDATWSSTDRDDDAEFADADELLSWSQRVEEMRLTMEHTFDTYHQEWRQLATTGTT